MQQHICYGCMKVIAEEVCPHCGWSVHRRNMPHQLQAGTMLRGQFLVGRVLGQGGFGITYIGMDVKQNKVVAIKEYYPSFAVTRNTSRSNRIRLLREDVADEFISGRERFLQESTLYAKFHNIPEIVTIHSLFTDNDTSYIVIDYITGVDLRKYVTIQGGKLSGQKTLSIFRPIIRALGAVHRAGLVHRDITPDNIMLLPDGSVKLLDFGAAHEICNPDPNAQIDHSTTAILKHGFAPPEQYKSRGNLGPWTDEYGLCASIYYCIHGETPPEAMERMLNKLTLQWDCPDLTPHQREVLNRGMALQPADRYGSMEALEKDLYRTPASSASEPVSNPGDTTGPGSGDGNTDNTGKKKPPFEKIFPIAAACLAILLILTLVIPKIGSDSPKPDDNLPAPTETATPETAPDQEFQQLSDRCEHLWADGEYDAVLEEVHYQYILHPDDNRYEALVLHYEQALYGAIVEDAREISLTNYPAAIQLLDTACKKYCDPAFGIAAADFRMEFGISNASYIAAGRYSSILIQDDGHVVVAGEDTYHELDARTWTDIVCVAAGDNHIVGLRSDGSVVTVGDNQTGQRNVESWDNVVAIAAGDYHTVGLRYNGTLVAAGQMYTPRCDMEGLYHKAGGKRIVSIAAGYLHTIALLEDGTVIAVGENGDHQCNVEDWTDIAAIYAGTKYSLGLKTDGTVVKAGFINLNVSGWMDIVNLSAGDFFAVAIAADGTLLSVGMEDEEDAIGPNTVKTISTWHNNVQIAAGNDHIVVLTRKGITRCAGKNDFGQIEMDGFEITYPRTLIYP